ncbi:MAG: hypothetical protein HZC01_00490 [Candidatus Kerfeldbacteria bacterium]|nr:hypothetical protein [Candidatus Kerfeldbacteria bacterium]
MKELVQYIRAGVASGAVEELNIWGAGIDEGRVEANVIGMALIGKIGTDRAIAMFELALDEIAQAGPTPHSEAIMKELGLHSGQTEQLVELQFQGLSAAEIADKLESEEITLDNPEPETRTVKFSEISFSE